MIKFPPSPFLAGLLGLLLHVASAQAQYVHTCVSAARGDDANTCHCTQPCRSFQRAHDQTLDQGQVTVLDAGGYGRLTITKSISIVNDNAGTASIVVSEGYTGITVNAPADAGYVNLRGITVQGVGFGDSAGLVFNTGFTLTVTNCVFRNLAGRGFPAGSGITFQPDLSRTGGVSSLAVSNTLVADSFFGLRVAPSAGGVTNVALSRVEAYNNSNSGIVVHASGPAGKVNVEIADSVSASNGTGFEVGSLGATTNVTVTRSVATNNGMGLYAANGSASLRIGQSTITGNQYTWTNSGATLQSFGDNYVGGNSDGDPAAPGGTVATK
jgi:hypothetical protein